MMARAPSRDSEALVNLLEKPYPVACLVDLLAHLATVAREVPHSPVFVMPLWKRLAEPRLLSILGVAALSRKPRICLILDERPTTDPGLAPRSST